MINASHFTPVDEGLIPLGEIQSVEDSPFDFRRAKTIGRDLNQEVSDIQLSRWGGYDHNFVLDKKSQGSMSFAARVVDPKSGDKWIYSPKNRECNFMEATLWMEVMLESMEQNLNTVLLLHWRPNIILIHPISLNFKAQY